MGGSRINKDLLESNEKSPIQSSRRMPEFGKRPTRAARTDANEKLSNIDQLNKAKEDDFTAYEK